MTTMTIAPATTGGSPDGYRAGITAARLEHAQGTPAHILAVRADTMADYSATAYARGYIATVAALELEDAQRAAYDHVLAEYQRAAELEAAAL